MRILLVEDDKRISDFTVKGLREKGWFVTLAQTGEEARRLIENDQWDVILMDIMLPGIDGVQLTQLIRHKNNDTPVLVVSALSEAEDKVRALNFGADDYLSKPFDFNELTARINALTRRFKKDYSEQSAEQEYQGLRVDRTRHKVFRDDRPVELSPKEFKLLLFLMENKEKVVTRTQILNAVWGIDYENYTNVVDVYISYLRNKIDEGRNEKLIRTVKGRGYMLSCED